MLDPTELDPCKEPVQFIPPGAQTQSSVTARGKGGWEVGGVVQEGGDIWILMADSC